MAKQQWTGQSSTQNLPPDRRVLWGMVGVLGLAFALRVPLLNGPRFHTDEALFASFARSIAVWRDPLLAAAPVDKPPLLFYLQALCYPFLGPQEMAARLPNLFASLITVALTFAAAKRLPRLFFGNPSVSSLLPLLAAGLVALSPLAVALAATAFTDPLMVMWGMAAVVAAGRGRPGWAGVWLGLGMATKYQALFFVPLAAGLLWLISRPGWRGLARFVAGILPPVAAVLLWDWVRTGGISLFTAQMQSYGGIHWLPAGELGGRLLEWGSLAGTAIGAPLLGGVVLLGVLVLVSRATSPHSLRGSGSLIWLFSGWLLAYVFLHWVLDARVWDRYLLPAVPVLSLLVGVLAQRCYALLQSSSPKMQRALRIMLLVLVVTILPYACLASAGKLPIGGDHGQYDGIEQVAEFLAPYPYGTVLYHHEASWHLRYYLFDSRVYASWFAEPAALVDNLQVFGTHPAKFLLVSTWEPFVPIEQALHAADLLVEPAFSASRPDGSVSFVVYRIME